MKLLHHTPLWDQSPPEVWRHWQLRQLRHYLTDRVIPFSTHYRTLFEEHDFRPDDLRSLDDLIRLAKAQPGKLTYASSGIGTSPHLSGVLFSTLTGVQMSHVPYRGSTPAVTDLLSGQVQIMFSPASSVLQYIRAHRLDALAVTSARRASVLPDLPTIDELGLKGFETTVWYGLVVPVGTPREPIERIAMATRFSLASNEVQSLFKAQGIEIVDAGAEEFARYLRSEASKWSAVIREADIHPE